LGKSNQPAVYLNEGGMVKDKKNLGKQEGEVNFKGNKSWDQGCSGVSVEQPCILST